MMIVLKRYLLFIILLFLLPIAFAERIILQTPNSTFFDDAKVLGAGLGDTNFGNQFLVVDDGGVQPVRSYLTFDRTNITFGSTIEDAIFCFTSYTFENPSGIAMHEVFNNVTWQEDIITWNNQPCGTGFDTPQCNLTVEDNKTITGTGFHCLNGTFMWQKALLDNAPNVSIIIKGTDEGSGGKPNSIRHKEHATVSVIPLWNISFTPAADIPDEFTVSANDAFDSVTLINFSVTFTNTTTSFHNSSGSGSLVYTDLNGIYDINISSNQSDGYFERKFFDVNTTSDIALAAAIFQSVARVKALDGFDNSSISTFTASINGTTPISTTNGTAQFLLRAGSYAINVTAIGFEMKQTTFSIAALENNTVNVSLGSIFNFNLIRESTGVVFDWNNTNRTEINVFCPNQTINLLINGSDKNSANISQIISCRFTLVQAVVDYGALGSYFRTIIPSVADKNITIYLIDVRAGDIAVQKVLKLLDLTGEFGGAILRVKNAVAGVLRTVIEQRFDISDEVNLFLVKDRLYTINIENNVQDIGLGNLIPTEAGEQSITLPQLAFAKHEAVLGGNITFGYTFNITTGILRVQYNDSTQKTTLVRFTIINGSDTSDTLFTGESNNNATVTLTFNGITANQTYLTELFVQHPDLTSIDTNIDGFLDKRTFYETSGTSGGFNLAGWNITEQTNIKKWAAWIFIFFWAFLFSARHVGIGMTTMAVWIWMFRLWKWIEISNLIFGFIVLLAIVGWLVESLRKQ